MPREDLSYPRRPPAAPICASFCILLGGLFRNVLERVTILHKHKNKHWSVCTERIGTYAGDRVICRNAGVLHRGRIVLHRDSNPCTGMFCTLRASIIGFCGDRHTRSPRRTHLDTPWKFQTQFLVKCKFNQFPISLLFWKCEKRLCLISLISLFQLNRYLI